MKVSPGKGCKDRNPPCCGKCERYKEWKSEQQKESQETTKQNISLLYMYDYGGKWQKFRYRKKGRR